MTTMYHASYARKVAESKGKVDYMTSIVEEIKEIARQGGFSLTRYVAGWDNVVTAKKILKSWGYSVMMKKHRYGYPCAGHGDILGAELTISWKE